MRATRRSFARPESHPGLTVIYHADLVENVPYLVLEYVDGPTLRQVSKQTGPLSVAATLGVMDAVSTAIGELHERGIIHRDIKPSNVLLDRDGHVFVTDFGLARVRPLGKEIQFRGAAWDPVGFGDGASSPHQGFFVFHQRALSISPTRATTSLSRIR